MEKPKISVIVPVYNSLNCLERCVESICGQTFEELEIILVDDGSTDGTGPLCDRLAKRDSRIRVYHKENGGASSARNLGLEMRPAIMSASWTAMIILMPMCIKR